MNCLFIGTISKDLLMLVKEPPKSDRRIEAVKIQKSCGGPAATAANAFAGLGGTAGLITAIGADANGQFVRGEAERIAGKRLQLFTKEQGVTSFSTIQVEEDGKRCITHFGGCIDGVRAVELEAELLAWAEMIHLAGLKDGQMLELAGYCRSHSRAKLSVDGGNLGGDILLELSGFVDILAPDHKTVRDRLGLGPEEACEKFVENGTALACVTMGEQGLTARQGGQTVRIPACRVPAVDTTGAGDNFHGALLYALSKGQGLRDALSFASSYSALTCTALGGQTASPSLEATLTLMRETYNI